MFQLKFKLKKIKIKNFYSYQNAVFSNLTGYNVLIGQNNAGKSNFFRLFMALRNNFKSGNFDNYILFDKKKDEEAIISFEFKLEIEYRKNFFSKLYETDHFANTFNPTVYEPTDAPKPWNEKTIEWLINEGYFKSILIRFSYEPKIGGIILKSIFALNKDSNTPIFRIIINGNDIKLTLLDKDNLTRVLTLENFFNESLTRIEVPIRPDIKSLSDFHHVFILNKLNLKNKRTLMDFIPFSIIYNDIVVPLFDSFLYIPATRQYIGENDILKLENTIPSPSGDNISKFIMKNKANNPTWNEDFLKTLQSYFPNIEDFTSTIQNDKTSFHLKESKLENTLNLNNLGLGLMNLVNLLINFKFYLKNKLFFFIEEPELFIFPGLQKKLRETFLEISKTNYVFITTHSPNFIGTSTENCSIYQIKKENNSTKVERISEENILEVFKELDLSLYDYILYDGIMFVEGLDDLNVFKIISDEIFDPKFKIIQCYGKKNFRYYAEAEILHLLTESDLKYLFLLDLDRGNANIWSKIKVDELKIILEEHTIRLFSYEIENIFLQPILIIDYLFTRNKIQSLVADSRWLFENLERIFSKKGENDLKYILKKFIDSNYDWFGRDDYDYIYNGSENISALDDLHDYWIKKIEELLNKKDEFCEVKIKEKAKILEKFNEIKETYDDHYSKKEYFKIISGKDVIKELKVLLTNKFKLSETISVENLSIHLLKFLKDYDYLYSEKDDRYIHNFNEKNVTYEPDKMPITKKELIDFVNYLEKLKKLIVGIKNKLNCEFQLDFKKLDRIDFRQMFDFLIKRWNLSL